LGVRSAGAENQTEPVVNVLTGSLQFNWVRGSGGVKLTAVAATNALTDLRFLVKGRTGF